MNEEEFLKVKSNMAMRICRDEFYYTELARNDKVRENIKYWL